MKTIIETTLLIGAVGLLQWHGGWFWYHQTGITGVVFSVLIEIAALLLWYQPESNNTLPALICSALVVAGPFYKISEPLLQGTATATTTLSSTNDRITALKESITDDKATLKDYRDNSKDRGGWLPAMNRIDARKATDNATLQTLLKQRATTQQTATLQWLTYTTIVIQAIGLLFLQLTQIKIIRSWRPVKNADTREPETPSNATNDKVQQVINAVLAGKYQGANLFTVRNIIATEGVRHEHVKAAFDIMVNKQQMNKTGNRYILSNK